MFPFPKMIDQQTEQIAHENDKKHEKDMHRLAPGIEKQACDEQENIFQNFCIPEKRVVEEQYDRQEYEQKGLTWEKHDDVLEIGLLPHK